MQFPHIPHSITVTVKRPAGTDAYGDPLPGGTEHTVSGCAIAPRTSEEQQDRRQTVIVGLALYGPYDADIEPTDTVVLPDDPLVPVALQGTEWHVEGEPGQWRSPWTGWKAGVEIALRRVTG
ncbi:hypothetical protein GCM10012275_52780 [Longimycelium tulufanense]|uniref:Head-to-tail stopper n=1 Tax=Longimycelium tulufanense TaxID=907463 RepID=A0A8J3FYX0_9PSEU|nr:hypothetical protein [Longimycelium tulufanense]GGM75535.1 hypothetical protein GCM10012275_52780 [Longimycelium tulufanense]